MEGGDIAGGNVEAYKAEFTWIAFFCCLVAASGGALFGYDNGELHAQRDQPAGFAVLLQTD